MAKKVATKQDRDNIRAAAANIPDLIARETGQKKPRHAETPYHSSHYKKRKQLVVFSVAFISLGLLGIWILNLQSKFYDYKTADKTEQKLFEEARTDIADIFDEMKARDAAAALATASSTPAPIVAVTNTPAVVTTTEGSLTQFFSHVATTITSSTPTTTVQE